MAFVVFEPIVDAVVGAMSDERVEPMHGRTVVLTGASDGIGRAAARLYVRAGASVVMIGRNEAKTVAAAQSIMSECGRRTVTWEIADLSRQDAIRDLAARLRARLPSIHVLANNAGAMFFERELTAEGLERTFALNHLNYFTLTMLLLDRMAAAATAGEPARIINMSSRAHRDARLDLDDLQLTRDFGGWRAYANSKLCNILFTRALARRLDASRVVVHSMHPGVVSTRFAVNNGRRGRMMRGLMDVIAISPVRGADTLLWLSHEPDALRGSGDYWVRRQRRVPSAAALRDADGERLWAESAALARVDATARVREAGLTVVGPMDSTAHA